MIKEESQEIIKTCFSCKHCYIDMHNNYLCRIKEYPESKVVCRNWGPIKTDAEKCKNYKELN
jgi:hypothetical protein